MTTISRSSSFIEGSGDIRDQNTCKILIVSSRLNQYLLPASKVYAISSEVQSKADEALMKWKLGRYDDVIGDNGNTLVDHLKHIYIPALVVTDSHDKYNPNGLYINDYPSGAVQPALLIFVGSNPALVWATRPTAANLQGSLYRPDPNDV
mmetsp:Transcript_57899/g.141467  ORF Transcript_57899/g.141467 Transcript_57899/m.141467 type:complete len:150 (-) Transcript_57899:371-820(-)